MAAIMTSRTYEKRAKRPPTMDGRSYGNIWDDTELRERMSARGLELVELAIPTFVRRAQQTIYRSMLRAEVRLLDKAKPVRTFGDKEEWKTVLATLAAAEKIKYVEATDTIQLLDKNDTTTE